MIEEIVSETFRRIGHVWKSTQGFFHPEEDDVRAALDEAARILYDRDVDTRLEVGGLIIDKRPDGHDVYVFVGNYK